MSAMEELGALLQSLQTLKPPGVTKTKIEAITAVCVQNVQSDSTVVQNIVHQFKNSPATHKLGVLYVIDSVTRQWVEKAKIAGQAVSRNAAPGTFASGVQNVTDALPALMNDLVQCAPRNQKEKISKLLDIWERGQTFPLNMLVGFKQQLNSPAKNGHTPPGSPPKGHTIAGVPASGPYATAQTGLSAPSAVDPGSILASLANFGQQNPSSVGLTNSAPAAPPAMPFLQNIAPPPPGFVPPLPLATNGQPALPPLPMGGNDLMNQILHAIASGMIPPDQAVHVLAALTTNQSSGPPLIPPSSQPPAAGIAPPVAPNSAQSNRFEQDGSRYRDRSRSPDYNRRRNSPRRSPPHRRNSPTYDAYDPATRNEANTSHRSERSRGRGRHRSRNEFRQRTPPPPPPPPQRRQSSPGVTAARHGQPKFLEWDRTLPRDNIRVLSRTLFVGGAGGTEGEIRSIFSRFGKVQTCIVNQDKRIAFVKMVNRVDAVSAKEGMDKMQDQDALAKARQTRWGVGFGPRDCSDYDSGVSVIPISRLTDADRKWVLTAEFGGTGGRALEGGMVIEEPDIEIGAGVSSKAISRRVPPDGGRRGGHGFGSRGGGFDNGPRFRKDNRPPIQQSRHITPRAEVTVAVPPAVPGFGFQLPGMSGF
ncbi:uncharacterized protein BDR25DRAFT_107458 [Lindgomyces ingoldianus]|uniref:Uncharacterized protein n=1 Tax=Lindgomyces ingoldianus TaxID=673940 RepID=A0ACB6Q9K1_9PLEO|nr:uncharacterized protein BDR25DRAFT_107458 [Lindgomyces ingoldianus]KAF2463633.1 hypothetical protein BDR25DRAFT_107458 [Lindgomyces ingoldianus]